MKPVIPTGRPLFLALLLTAMTGCEVITGDEKDEQLKPEAQHLVGTWTATGDSGITYKWVFTESKTFSFEKFQNGASVYRISGTWEYRTDGTYHYVDMSWKEGTTSSSSSKFIEPFDPVWSWTDPDTNKFINFEKG